MANWIEIGLMIAGVAALAAGFFVQARALACYGRPDAPAGPTFNVRRWKPVWKCADWFDDPRGFELYVMGSTLQSMGLELALLVLLFRALS